MNKHAATTPNTPASPVQPTPATKTQGLNPANPSDLNGLFAAGQVIARRRLAFPQADKTVRYNHTFTLSTGSGVIRVERWCDLPTPADAPELGQHVVIPVTPVIYNTKSGTNFRLTWGAAERGEEY